MKKGLCFFAIILSFYFVDAQEVDLSFVQEQAMSEETIELHLQLLDAWNEYLDQAERLENGNYQIAGVQGGTLALIAYTLKQIKKGRRISILDLSQLRYFNHRNLMIKKEFKELKTALKNYTITLKANHPHDIFFNKLEASNDLTDDFYNTLKINNSPDQLPLSILENDIHALDEIDDIIEIQSDVRHNVSITRTPTRWSSVSNIGDLTITFWEGTDMSDDVNIRISHSQQLLANRKNFMSQLKRALKTSVHRYVPPVTNIIPGGTLLLMAIIYLFSASDLEAIESQNTPTDFEITPEMYEHIQDEISIVRNNLQSLF